MKFLDFFKEVDDNRRRSKRIIINLLYFLAPVVMLATSFTNEHIISKCEDIHHYNTSLEQEVIELKEKCNQPAVESSRNMDRKISELERNNRILKKEIDALKNKDNSELVEQNRKYREEISQLEQQRDAAAQALALNREELKKACDEEKRRLREELAARTAPSKGDDIAYWKNQLYQLQNKYDILKAEYGGLEQKQASVYDDNQRLSKVIADLRRQLTECERSRSRTYTIDIEEVNIIPKNQISRAKRLVAGSYFKIVLNGQDSGYIITGK